MLLKIKDRILLLNVLPQENNFATLRIVRKLKENLSFTEEELKEFEIIVNGNQIKWNLQKDKEVEIEIGEKATDIIIEALKKLDKDKKLTLEFIEIYEKFIKE